MENVITVSLKWNKMLFENIAVNLDESIDDFKVKLNELTKVPI